MIYQQEADQSALIADKIYEYFSNENLSFLNTRISCEILAMQLIESMKRISYFQVLSSRDISFRRTDPQDPIFDPVRAILYLKDINYDEACWLTFLLVYTAENYQTNWNFMRQLYGGVNETLTWEVARNNPQIFPQLADMLSTSQSKPKFGNHRKYESLRRLPQVFESYINLVNAYGGHRNLFRNTDFNNKKEYFKQLFSVVESHICSFGRLSTFDYLSMMYKTGLANIEADCCYIVGSTGPKDGAKLLFGSFSDAQLDSHAMGLADYLGIGYQEMEDALCNWQKSPSIFHSYTG